MTVLVTGAAGFIGYHLSQRLLADGIPVIGYDNFNAYYDPGLKRARAERLHSLSRDSGTPFQIIEADLEDRASLEETFHRHHPQRVVNLAGQAGVRHSIQEPAAFIQANLVGFGNVLECCRHHGVEHLVYASSSSVYGGNTRLPFRESDGVNHPVSLYAASKRANELMAHTYSHLYGLAATGLRFFTVYGPWSRPDMAMILFTKAILDGSPIQVFNEGRMQRDFTYVLDVVESIVRVLARPAAPDPCFDAANPDPAVSWAPHRIFNVGNADPVPLMTYIEALETALGITASKVLMPMQAGDVVATAADTTALERWIGFRPRTPIQVGVDQFVAWYRDYYGP